MRTCRSTITWHELAAEQPVGADEAGASVGASLLNWVFGEHFRERCGAHARAAAMRKRHRKKRRLGEFRENLFGVRYQLRAGLGEEAADDFLWRFLERAIESNGLACGGGGQGEAWEFYVSLAIRGSPTEGQRAAVGAWLGQQAEVRTYALSDFFDGWHGPEEAPYGSGPVGVGA